MGTAIMERAMRDGSRFIEASKERIMKKPKARKRGSRYKPLLIKELKQLRLFLEEMEAKNRNPKIKSQACLAAGMLRIRGY